MKHSKVEFLGMKMDRWIHESCEADFGVGKDWATLYTIRSTVPGKGHATALLTEAKKFYESKGKAFAGTVALNPRMASIYKKLGIRVHNLMTGVTVCRIDETQQVDPDDMDYVTANHCIWPVNIRDGLTRSYDIPRYFYQTDKHGATSKVSMLGSLIWYGVHVRKGRCNQRRIKVDVDALVSDWERVVVGLALAHDKDEADRFEAEIEKCLSPILTAPIAQVREFYPKLLQRMRDNPSVPFMIWRAFQVWIDQIVERATDEAFVQLRTDIAERITQMVHPDISEQLPAQLVRAFQWRTPEQLEKVEKVVKETKQRGEKVRLRGRESCLFLEAGGTPEVPEVCIQI